MVKKIKKRTKTGKVKFNWKVILAIIGALAMVIFIMWIIGTAGAKSMK